MQVLRFSRLILAMSFLPAGVSPAPSYSASSLCLCCSPPDNSFSEYPIPYTAPLKSPTTIYDTHVHVHLSKSPSPIGSPCDAYPELSVVSVLQAVTPTDSFPPNSISTVGLHPWYIPKPPGVYPYEPAVHFPAISPDQVTEADLAQFVSHTICDLDLLPTVPLPPPPSPPLSLITSSPIVQTVLHAVVSSRTLFPPILHSLDWLAPLLSAPHSSLIGETGLDKLVAKKDQKSFNSIPLVTRGGLSEPLLTLCTPANVQLVVFVLHLLVAAEKNSVISIHSVKSAPLILSCFEYLASFGKLAGIKAVRLRGEAVCL